MSDTSAQVGVDIEHACYEAIDNAVEINKNSVCLFQNNAIHISMHITQKVLQNNSFMLRCF